MSFKKLIIPCLMLGLLSPLAEAKHRKNKIPKRAKYTHITGAKHFKYKSPKKQKLNH
jgi:hypothetical protein